VTFYKMIIVDDEAEIRDALCHYFPWEELGFTIVGQFDHGKQALDYIMNHTPHVVFSDIKMPVMSGLELAKELHAMNLHTKIVLLSGYAEFEFAKQAMVYGVRDYLLKPAKYKELIEVFSRIKDEIDRQLESKKSPAQEIEKMNYDEKVIETVKRYIESHYRDANLKDASVLVNLNPSYLSNFFKKKTGLNFTEYVLMQRMKKASEQLQDIHKKIYEISEDVGYSNAKNFTRTFKTYYGVTPMEYRRGVERES